jgi:FkbM family methyltransferase
LHTIIDVGANVGDFSLAMSRNCGRIIALEPGFQNFSTLVSNIEFNSLSNVIPLNVAAHDSSEQLTLIGENPDLRVEKSGFGPKVKGISLDEVARQHNIGQIDLVKIDVQGHEMSVIRGMRNIFQAHSARLVIVEVHPGRGTSSQEMISVMSANGYRFITSDDSTPRNPQLYFSSNRICIDH